MQHEVKRKKNSLNVIMQQGATVLKVSCKNLKGTGDHLPFAHPKKVKVAICQFVFLFYLKIFKSNEGSDQLCTYLRLLFVLH